MISLNVTEVSIPPQGEPKGITELNHSRLEGERFKIKDVDSKSTQIGCPCLSFLRKQESRASGFRVAFHLPGMTTLILYFHVLTLGSSQW